MESAQAGADTTERWSKKKKKLESTQGPPCDCSNRCPHCGRYYPVYPYYPHVPYTRPYWDYWTGVSAT